MIKAEWHAPRISNFWACDQHALSRGRAAWMCLATGVMSGALVYLMDPERGKRRRHMARDRMLAHMRRMLRAMRGRWHEAAAETHAATHRIVHLVPRQTDVADDETLRQRIESQLFRDRHIPKGDLNISCEHGMVILRGELDGPIEIAQLEERVRRTPGVRGVQNLLHQHGTPAPNKERSWRASPHALR